MVFVASYVEYFTCFSLKTFKDIFSYLPLFQAMVSQIWLLAKQRTWKAGLPRYIPNSGVLIWVFLFKLKNTINILLIYMSNL